MMRRFFCLVLSALMLTMTVAAFAEDGSRKGERGAGGPGGGQSTLQQGIEQMTSDPDAAMQSFLEALEAGNKKAARYVGMMYEQGLGVGQDYAMAAQYYEQGIASGDLTSYYYLGLLYEQGLGVAQDYARAAELFTEVSGSDNKSATGVVAAGYELGRLYELGQGVDQSAEKAMELYREAADNGNEDAAAALERLEAE